MYMFAFGAGELNINWTDEIQDEFEKLCHTGEWKVIMASRIDDEGVTSTGNVLQNGDSSLPVIKLIDTNTTQVRFTFTLSSLAVRKVSL